MCHAPFKVALLNIVIFNPFQYDHGRLVLFISDAQYCISLQYAIPVQRSIIELEWLLDFSRLIDRFDQRRPVLFVFEREILLFQGLVSGF